MFGTLVNALSVLLGSVIGLIIHSRLSKEVKRIAFQGIGIFTLVLGMSMALKTQNFLPIILSIVLGSIIGQLINIEKHISTFFFYVQKKAKIKNAKFIDGLTTAFLLFCMGSMTILGAVQEGLDKPPDLFYAKSVLDGFSSIALAASYGIGVMFSIVPLIIYQGGLTLFFGTLGDILSLKLISEVSAVGGILLIGLGINILELKKIPILNMIPSLVVIVIIYYFMNLF